MPPDYWDRPLLDDFHAPAGRCIRDIAHYFSLVVPDAPVPASFLQAADRLHEAAARLREDTRRYHAQVTTTYGEWSPVEIAVRVLAESGQWRELAGAVKTFEHARKNYTLSRQVEARRAG